MTFVRHDSGRLGLPRIAWLAVGALLAACGCGGRGGGTPTEDQPSEVGPSTREYSRVAIDFGPVRRSDHARHLAAVRDRIGAPEGYREVRVRHRGLPDRSWTGAEADPGGLPLAAAVVLRGLDCDARPDQELDILVPIEAEGAYAVTVWCESGGAVTVAGGSEPAGFATPTSAARLPTTAPGAATEVQRRFGVGPFVDRAGRWTAAELGFVAAALGRMTREERAVLGDVPFVRDRVGDGGPEGESAYYELKGAEAAIVVLDSTFDAPILSFVGTPDSPFAPATFVVLHEAGHAIARASVRAQATVVDRAVERSRGASGVASGAYDDYLVVRAEYERKVARVQEAVASYNLIVDRLQDSGGGADRAALLTELERLGGELDRGKVDLAEVEARVEAAGRRVEAENTAAGQARADAEAQIAEARRLAEDSPLLVAFTDVPGAGLGPTSYGREGLSESFAESYALFRLDPDALRRFSPQLHDWFARGEHTRWLPVGTARRRDE